LVKSDGYGGVDGCVEGDGRFAPVFYTGYVCGGGDCLYVDYGSWGDLIFVAHVCLFVCCCCCCCLFQGVWEVEVEVEVEVERKYFSRCE